MLHFPDVVPRRAMGGAVNSRLVGRGAAISMVERRVVVLPMAIRTPANTGAIQPRPKQSGGRYVP